MAPGNTSHMPTVPTVSLGAGRARRRFDGQRHFGAGEERIAPFGHEHRAGVAALAFDMHAQAGGRGDRGDDADVEAARLEERPLFDVQLDERGISLAGERNR